MPATATAAPAVWDAPTHPQWRQLGSRLTDWVDSLTPRRDVLVSVLPHHPGSGQPAGVFNHRTARITLDATHAMPGRPDPDRIDLRDERDRARFPVLTGVLAHEAGHATHTTRRQGLAGPVAEWAAVLEEPRMEGRVASGNPQARRWLQASALHLLGQIDPASTDHAARTLVLLGGRILAGVLDEDSLPDLDAVLAPWLTAEQIAVIAEQTARAVTAVDGDTATIAAAAEKIASLFGDDSESDGAEEGDDDCGVHHGAAGEGPLATALTAVAVAASRELRAAAGIVDPSPAAVAARAARHARTALAVDDQRAARQGLHESRRRRPTADDQKHAKVLTRSLETAALPAVDVTRTPSSTPPGRLRTSQLVRRQGQIHARVRPTATPWENSRRRTVDTPRLVVGVALDISGSMESFAAPTAVAAWALARAVRQVGGKAATVTWNHSASLLPVAATSGSVPVPSICGGSTGLPAALRVLDRELTLNRAQGARMVVVVTDGDLPNDFAVRDEAERLIAAGVRILWLVTEDGGMTAPAGAEIALIEDPGRIGELIGIAAVAALRAETRR
ncbi:hypothetical protein O4328_39415 [Rhodococcus opacus]|uniref:VWA domain-containing protein n=1 Tax=Rhodococcus opacus TaxID=37919 RepID=A0AAX3YPU3_RHOOP|nr:hypothetical protein [Rhodococcus opacus]MCZ4589641.1 hypothetical protein [Rhodococcus opacus]WLF51200.1 hypothetical protein Q5707_38205 [Rhodococcus opacus]